MKHKRLFTNLVIFTSIILILVGSFRVYLFSLNTEEFLLQDVKKEATLMKDYMLSMRKVYHHQFIDSGIELNEKTIGFLPAHASTLISDEFQKRNSYNFYIRNVSDNPRNPKNMADSYELQAIEYFKKNKTEQDYFVSYKKNNLEEGYQYAIPIYTEGYCLACHGKRENSIETIKKLYDSAYDYNIGDIRGIVSIKIPKETAHSQLEEFVFNEILTWLITLFLIIGILFIAYKKIQSSFTNDFDKINIDAQTGLFNRCYINNFLLENRDKNSFIILIEIDDFAQLYGKYGYINIDMALKDMANRIKKSLNINAIICRYESGKFLVIVQDSSEIMASAHFQTIKSEVLKSDFVCGTNRIPIQFSFALSSLETITNLENPLLAIDRFVNEKKS